MRPELALIPFPPFRESRPSAMCALSHPGLVVKAQHKVLGHERTGVESKNFLFCCVEVSVSFIEGFTREQVSLLPPRVDDYVAPDALVRVVDAFVASLNLAELGFVRAVAAATGRPGVGSLQTTARSLPSVMTILRPSSAPAPHSSSSAASPA